MNERFAISTDPHRLQLDRIHRFLSTEAYWCLRIPKETVARAIANSLCFGIYDQLTSPESQVGFVRVVTDRATFAWICDVYIEKESRGFGLGKCIVDFVMQHADLQGLRRVCLATKDAHDLYRKYGFKVTETPGNWMEIKNGDIYP
ncbi:GNAT family N-acetyltransferase [soil metagenome]